MTATFDLILRDLKNKIYHPIYLLEGEEPYFIDLVSDYIENNLLPESERSFNQTILYGKDTTINEIRQRAMNYPMLSNYQVLIVKEAQMLKKWDELLLYAEKPVKTTVLVLCHRYDNFDKRTKVAKAIQSTGVVMTTKKLYDNQVPDWIHEYLKERNLTIHEQAAELLVEYVGNELSRVVNELEKLILNVKPGKEISIDDIEDNIGISKEYNTFELNKAIGLKDVLKANRIIGYFKANPKSSPLVVTIGSLFGYFSKIYLLHQAKPKTDGEIAAVLGIRAFPVIINEYKAAARNYPAKKTEQVIGLLQEYDLRSKGVNDTGSEDGALMKELVYKILH
ncbi:MAG: DNA polymerase III subunit delta [Chitinophagales bacterium]